jgi:hypothetical protein
LENIIKYFPCGKILSFFYKLLFLGDSGNTENFIKANIPKILLCDPKDNLVVEFSSLKSSISNRHIMHKFISINNNTKNHKENSSILLYSFDYDIEDFNNFKDILFLINFGIKNTDTEENILNIKSHLVNFSLKKNLINTEVIKYENNRKRKKVKKIQNK